MSVVAAERAGRIRLPANWRRRFTRRKILAFCARWALLGLALFVFLTPVVWLLLLSFRPEAQWTSSPPDWIPNDWTTFSYKHMWNTGAEAGQTAAGGGGGAGKIAIVNSLIITSSATAAAMIIGTLAAYSISKFRTGGKNFALWVLSIKFLPPIIFTIPLLLIFSDLNLVNTYEGMILIYTVFSVAFVVWMMKGFFDEVPRDVEESARVDGCSWFGTMWRISLPLVVPGFVAVCLLTFIFLWTELLFAVIFLSGDKHTIPVELFAFFTPNQGLKWGPQAAMSIMAIAPVLAFALVIQKYLIRGMTFGAVRE